MSTTVKYEEYSFTVRKSLHRHLIKSFIKSHETYFLYPLTNLKEKVNFIKTLILSEVILIKRTYHTNTQIWNLRLNIYILYSLIVFVTI